KILKLRPHDEHVLLNAADIAAGQGLLAEARVHLNTVNEQRRSRGDASQVIDAEAFISRVTAIRRLSVDTPEAAPTVPDPRSSDDPRVFASRERIRVAAAVPAAPPVAMPADPPGSSSLPQEIPTTATGSSTSAAKLAQPVERPPAPRDLEDVFADLRKDA